jgi:hypothetical protein
MYAARNPATMPSSSYSVLRKTTRRPRISVTTYSCGVHTGKLHGDKIMHVNSCNQYCACSKRCDFRQAVVLPPDKSQVQNARLSVAARKSVHVTTTMLRLASLTHTPKRMSNHYFCPAKSIAATPDEGRTIIIDQYTLPVHTFRPNLELCPNEAHTFHGVVIMQPDTHQKAARPSPVSTACDTQSYTSSIH